MLDVGEGRGEEDVVVDEEQITIGQARRWIILIGS